MSLIGRLAPGLLSFAAGAAMFGAGKLLERVSPAWSRPIEALGALLMVIGIAMGSRYYALGWWLFYLAQIGVFIAALWRGGWRERVLSGLQVADMMLSLVWISTGWLGGMAFPERLWRSLGFDSITLALCVIMLVRARRYWMVWATVFALLWLVTDVATLAFGWVTFWGVMWTSNIWVVGMLAAITWGVWQSWRDGEAPHP